MSRRTIIAGILAAALVATLGLQQAQAKDKPGKNCSYDLDVSGTGTAEATIKPKQLRVKIRDAEPHTLYTVWVDFRARSTLTLAPDYPDPVANPGLDLSLSGPGVARGVAPAIAATAPVFSGMGIDRNGVVTNAHGNANLRIRLDYNLLGTGTSPVTAADLVEQDQNRVGGGWLRIYTAPLSSGASVQEVDDRGLPLLYRATAQGLTIVGHYDHVTHGHTPGVGGVDHFSGFKGDFPADCR